MPRIYARVRRPVVRAVNPLVLPQQPAPTPVVEAVPEPAEDLSTLTKAELVERATEAGVTNYGTKAELIERLEGV